MAITVDQQSPAVAAMACEWEIAEALMGGTPTMRAAGTRLLPKWPNEDLQSYQQRLLVSVLFPAFKRTVGVMTAKPFAKQLTLGDDVPQSIKDMCDDVDLEGHNLHAFAGDILAEVMAYGICGVLVDYPRVTLPEARPVSKAEIMEIGARPYLVMVKHKQILGWLTEKVNGVTKLSQLRIAEAAEIPDGEYGTKIVNRVRVLTPGAYEVLQKNDKGTFDVVESGPMAIDEIPFVMFYGRRTGFMTAVSPLLDLAYLNVAHWQSSSDQATLLHVARVPILVMIGAEESTALTIGAAYAAKLPANAELKYVEHSGKAIEAGRQSIADIEDQMIQTGAQMLVNQAGQKTATEVYQDAEAAKSDLQRITEGMEDSLDAVIELMAEWSGEPLSESATSRVTLFKDFGTSVLTDISAQLILGLQQGGIITKETVIQEMQRRALLSPDIVPSVELDEVAEEGPQLGTMGMQPGGGGPAATTAIDSPKNESTLAA